MLVYSYSSQSLMIWMKNFANTCSGNFHHGHAGLVPESNSGPASYGRRYPIGVSFDTRGNAHHHPPVSHSPRSESPETLYLASEVECLRSQ